MAKVASSFKTVLAFLAYRAAEPVEVNGVAVAFSGFIVIAYVYSDSLPDLIGCQRKEHFAILLYSMFLSYWTEQQPTS